jgi:hypothetical protein
MAKNANKTPFGLQFLAEIPAEETRKINGGMRTRHYGHKPPGGGVNPGGPIFTTQFVSMPSTAFPQGDHG